MGSSIKKAIFLCTCTFLSSGSLSYATPASSELEKRTTELQDDVDTITGELDSLGTELEDTAAELKTKADELETAELELAAARLNEEKHYNAMKERIKFMYEGGNLSLLQILLSSESMADFLNNAEYVTQISDYDRDMLTEFQDICANVEKKQDELNRQKEELSKLETRLKKQKKELTSRLSETSGALEDYTNQLKEAQAAEAAVKEAKNADSETIALMAAILECEAGISYEGMIAVGTQEIGQ